MLRKDALFVYCLLWKSSPDWNQRRFTPPSLSESTAEVSTIARIQGRNQTDAFYLS